MIKLKKSRDYDSMRNNCFLSSPKAFDGPHDTTNVVVSFGLSSPVPTGLGYPSAAEVASGGGTGSLNLNWLPDVVMLSDRRD